MKRGIMMSLALVAILLSSILYLSMEMRNMADDVLSYRFTPYQPFIFYKDRVDWS